MKEKPLPIDRFGYDFIPAEFLPPGANEYWMRDAQYAELFGKRNWRSLKDNEIEILERNRNYCQNWNDFLVCDSFDPSLIRDSYFYGLVRIGDLQPQVIKHHDFCLPVGIRNSTIISCDVGNNAAIQNCAYISHYIIGDNCILSEVNEMQTTNHSKFGNGVVKDGEPEEVRVWIDVQNEAGGRSVLPFQDMIAADAFLWANYRDDSTLVEKLKDITQKQYGNLRGAYGVIGSGTVIKSCKIIKDTAVGERAYIKGANKIKNVTILSSAEEPTQIGEGVEIVNGIIGYACNIFYGCKAVRFVMGRNSSLKYGARLIHSVLGDNSTVSCCELLNNLIFPVHEQHHNNSFLIASLVQGMSNMAAAATIGSNHNSRANDGEIRANRGFWPGLAVSLKHSSVFASFVILAKGEYPGELNIPLPFSLVNNNVFKNRLEVTPAYYWMHNMYALERNSWKTKNRDKRKSKVQHIEIDYLAPDTVEEIVRAISFLQEKLDECNKSGHMKRDPETGVIRHIHCRYFEKGKREEVIVKPLEAIEAYRQMLHYYAVKKVAAFFDQRSELDYDGLCKLLASPPDSLAPSERITDWVNFGGQIVPEFRVDELRREIGKGKYKNWDEIHKVYDSWNETYQLDKCKHAWAVMVFLNECKVLSTGEFKSELKKVLETRRWIDNKIFETREKDYKNPFKQATFRNQEEMEQVLGRPEENAFINLVRKETDDFAKLIERVSKRVI